MRGVGAETEATAQPAKRVAPARANAAAGPRIPRRRPRPPARGFSGVAATQTQRKAQRREARAFATTPRGREPAAPRRSRRAACTRHAAVRLRRVRRAGRACGDAAACAKRAEMTTRRAAAAAASPRGSGGAHDDSAPIFLTVGTTRFDALVQAADDVAFAAAAEARGYTSLTIQARSPGARRTAHARCVVPRGRPI